MAKPGDVRIQKNSPGAGWKSAGRVKRSGVWINKWVYRPLSTGGSSGGGSGGGSSSGSSGGSSGSSGGGSGSAKADAKKRQYYKDAYNNFMDPTNKKVWKPSKKMLDLAVKNNWSLTTMYTWVRQNDPNYLNTAAAKGLISKFKTLLISIFGPTFKVNKTTNKDLYRAMISYAKLPPDKAKNNTVVMTYFRRYIVSNKKFKQLYPAFSEWFRSPKSLESGAFLGLDSPLDFIQQYKKLSALYASAYKQDEIGIGDAAAEIPEALLIKAMKNNWSTDGIEWRTAVRNTAEYLGSTGAEVRRQEFENNWERMFVGTQFEDSPPDEELADQYVKSNMNFSMFFNSVMNLEGSRSAALIDAAFPSYAGFLRNNPAYMSGQLDLFGEGGYFDQRQGFITMYKQMMSDPDALPDPDMLGKALSGAWSDVQWQLYIRENDTAYITSPSGQARIDVLERYWDALFGQDSPIDPDIERKWLVGETNTPEDLLGDIQELDIFKTNYPDYTTFQKGQVQVGRGAQADPGLYKAYVQDFKDAFANEGLDPEQFSPLMSQYFSSAVKGDEFKSNIAQWAAQQKAFKLTTRETPELAIAAGIARPEDGGAKAGGDLRKRMQQEFEKYRRFTQTAPEFETEKQKKNDKFVQTI